MITIELIYKIIYILLSKININIDIIECLKYIKKHSKKILIFFKKIIVVIIIITICYFLAKTSEPSVTLTEEPSVTLTEEPSVILE